MASDDLCLCCLGFLVDGLFLRLVLGGLEAEVREVLLLRLLLLVLEEVG